MKKLMLSAVIAMFGLTGLNAQSTGLEAGASIGFPIGDSGDYYSLNFGVNAAYYWTVAENFKAGIATGYDHWSAKDVTIAGVTVAGSNSDFIPVAAAAKYDFGGFFGGLDLGYAIAVTDGSGGFYYRPRVGYGTTTFDFYGFYKGISADGGSISAIGVGVDYKF